MTFIIFRISEFSRTWKKFKLFLNLKLFYDIFKTWGFFFFKKDQKSKMSRGFSAGETFKKEKNLVGLIGVLLYLASGNVYTPETMSFKVSFMANIYAPTDHCLQYALCCIFSFCVLEDGFWKLSLLCWCYEITFPYLLLYTFFTSSYYVSATY